MNELHVNANKVCNRVHLWQNVKNSLLYDVVQGIKELMVYLVRLVRKVKLINTVHVI